MASFSVVSRGLPRWLLATLTALLMLALAACGSSPRDDDIKGSAEKLYADAKESMANGSWGAAIKSLERVESRAGGSLLAQQAQLDLAYSYWKTIEKAQALSTLDKFIKQHPSSLGLDYALYLRGLINSAEDLGILGLLSGQTPSERDQQASREAYQSFKQLVDQFPESRYAPEARLRMDNMVNRLAEYEVHVAYYYLRRGAFEAAMNRAQQCLTVYPYTPAAEDALIIMADAYKGLGEPVLRADALRVLRLNFPNSSGTLSLLASKAKPWWQLW